MTHSVGEVVLVFQLSSVLNDGFQVRQVGAHFEDLLHLRIVFDYEGTSPRQRSAVMTCTKRTRWSYRTSDERTSCKRKTPTQWQGLSRAKTSQLAPYTYYVLPIYFNRFLQVASLVEWVFCDQKWLSSSTHKLVTSATFFPCYFAVTSRISNVYKIQLCRRICDCFLFVNLLFFSLWLAHKDDWRIVACKINIQMMYVYAGPNMTSACSTYQYMSFVYLMQHEYCTFTLHGT